MHKNKRTKGMFETSGHHKRSRSRSPTRKHNGHSKYWKKSGWDTSDSESDYESSQAAKYSRKREYKSDGSSKYHKENDHHRESRSSRWEKKSDEHKSRNRDKTYKNDNRASTSPFGGLIGVSGSELIGYKSHPPNNTIMIRGLADHITELDIRQDIIQCGLMPKDIRLIRKKITGASRGFAFVEFATLAEAVRWMDFKQGILTLQDGCRAILQYSIAKGAVNTDEVFSYKAAAADWFCIKCGAQNFKRRDLCYKCHASRMESEEGGSGSDEACSYVTKTLLFRNLDALTTEDSVLQAISNTLTEDVTKKISAVSIGRDPLTSISRGICYLGTESTADALTLYTSLIGVSSPFTIDGKTVIISYCKYNVGESRTQEFTSGATNSKPNTFSLSDVDRLAEYTASSYSKGVIEFEQNYKFYKDYYTQQILAGNSITLHMDKPVHSTNVGAAVAQSAIRQVHANKMHYDTSHINVPTGTDGKYYPTPDPSQFVFDDNSGFHFDSSTGLYYDPNSTYYWNSVIQKYLYFDPAESTYLLAPVSSSDTSNSQQQLDDIAKAQKINKYNKVPVARKIIKNMEKWAKSLNQKKADLASHSKVVVNVDTHTTGSANIGYAVLEESKVVNSAAAAAPNAIFENDSPLPSFESSTHTTSAYGETESSDNDDEDHSTDDSSFLNFVDFVCTLCKRQLNSADVLLRHAHFSDLHKKNLETLKNCHKEKQIETPSVEKIVYRDRAKERRMKYGYAFEPKPSMLKEQFLKSRELREASVKVGATDSISSENVGSRLLQKMGWTEGQGLGKSNQGRTTIIQAEQRNTTVGLGNKVAYTAQAGESYRDCVKKTMYARYRELS